MTDQDLLTLWVERRDPEAFREVVNRHAAMVYATCRRILRNASEAEDITQECFEALARAGRHPGAYLGAWLHRVATNRALRYLRTELRRRNRDARFAEANRAAVKVDWDEAYGYADEAINALPERLRVPLVLHFLENQTHDAIAETLGIARTTVTYRIAQGLDRVRKSLRHRGVTITAAALAALGAASSSEALSASLSASLGRLAIAGSELLPATSVGGLLTGLWGIKGILAVLVVIGAVAGVVYEIVHQVKPAPLIQSVRPIPARQVPGGVSPFIFAAANPAQAPKQPQASSGTIAVKGDVRIEGTGTPLHSVMLVLTDATGKEWRAETDSEGRFTFEGLNGGSYRAGLDNEVFVLKDAPVPVEVTAENSEQGQQPLVRLIADAGGSISGRVFDKSTGEGLPQVGLFFAPVHADGTVSPAGDEWKLETDRDGRYHIAGLRPGKYTVIIDQDVAVRDTAGNVLYRVSINWQSRVSNVVLTAGQQFSDIDFPVFLGGTIAGVVRDSQGRPAKSAWVQARSSGLPQRVETREDGTFTIHGIAATTECRVFARSGGEASEVLGPLTVPESGLNGLEIRMRPGGSIRGKLVDPQGAPLPSSTVDAFSSGTLQIASNQASTEKDGTFEIKGLSEGRYELQVTQRKNKPVVPSKPLATLDVKWGAISDNVVLVCPSDPARSGNLQSAGTPNGGLRISGRVTDASGKPVAGATVSAGIVEGAISRFAENVATTDTDGRYELKGLERKTYTVAATHPKQSRCSVSDVEGGSNNIDMILQPRASIEGRVTRADDGQPVTQFAITQGGAEPLQVADADGRFKLADVDTSGSSRLIVRAPGYAEWEDRVEFKPGETVREFAVSLRRTSGIEGRVVNPEGEPMAGARVFLAGALDRIEHHDESAVAARSGEDGAFRIDDVSAEAGLVVAVHTDYAEGSAAYRPGKTHLDIVLPRAGAVEGIVTSAGAPAAGIQVTVSRGLLEGYIQPSGKLVTGSDGAFHVGQLPPGEMMVCAFFGMENNNYLTARVVTRRVVIESGKTVSVDLDLPEATAGLEGQVRVAGRPANAIVVTFSYTQDSVESPYTTTVDDNGNYKFDKVPAGQGTLRAAIPNAATGTVRGIAVPVETVAGQVTRKDIDVIDTGVILANVTGSAACEKPMVSVYALAGEVAPGSPDLDGDLDTISKAAATGMLNADGTVRFEWLPAGTYTVVAVLRSQADKTLRPAATASGIVRVEDGAEAPVDLILSPVIE